MDPPFDVETLSPSAKRILDPASPAPLRQMAAKGLAPGIRPGEALTIIVVLAESADTAAATTARTTLDRLPPPLLAGALAGDLPPGVLAAIAPRYVQNVMAMERILAHPALPATAALEVAAHASEEVAELVATNEQRLIAHPEIIEKLYMNKATRMSTADRVLELAVRHHLELPGIPAYKEAAIAIGQELIAEASDEPTPDDLLFREVEAVASATAIDPAKEDTHRVDDSTGNEVVVEKFLPLHTRLAAMTVSQKIRLAMVGSARDAHGVLSGGACRLLLIRDSNRLVATSAIKSPLIQESEVMLISASRNVSEDVLRAIAMNREWTRSHPIKLNLVFNPRTPFAFAAKLIPHLREHELKALAKSKNVGGAVATAARQQLQRRNVG